MRELVEVDRVRRRKMVIFFCGILMYFLTSMSKVLIPAAIIGDLQSLGFNPSRIAATGAAYMYAYAGSQLLAGVFADRYGGVRILLIGGSLFAVGVLGFPLAAGKSFALMIALRIVTGFGAGTVFLGVAKLINDLFSSKFSLVLSAALVIGYFGPTAGTAPMTLLINSVGWKVAMLVPGMAAALAVAVIVSQMRGTIKPVTTGQSLLPLFGVLRNRNMWMLCLGTSVVFGVYYCISSYIGKQSLQDHCHIGDVAAASVIMYMTIVVALNNIGANLVLKLCGNRRKPAVFVCMFMLISGCALGLYAFNGGGGAVMVGAAYFLIALPAGFFPVFCTVGKELCPPENVALAVALVNFWCFVSIAVFQNIAGAILNAGGTYRGVFVFLLAAAVAGTVLHGFYPETRSKEVKNS